MQAINTYNFLIDNHYCKESLTELFNKFEITKLDPEMVRYWIDNIESFRERLNQLSISEALDRINRIYSKTGDTVDRHELYEAKFLAIVARIYRLEKPESDTINFNKALFAIYEDKYDLTPIMYEDRKKVRYTQNFKNKVVEFSKNHKDKDTAKKFKISIDTVRMFKKQKKADKL